jgi:hypothetical protein
VWHIPQPAISTNTSPGLISGTSRLTLASVPGVVICQVSILLGFAIFSPPLFQFKK